MSLTGIKSIITHLEYVKDVNVITKENMVLLLQEKSENRICCKCQYKNDQKWKIKMYIFQDYIISFSL